MSESSPKARLLPWLLGLSLLVNAGVLGGFLYHRYVMGPPVEHLAKIEHALHLSEPQRAELQRIQREIHDEARENFRITRDRHHELVLLLREEQVDMPALERHLRATTEPQVTLQRDVILRLLAFRQRLDAEQKEAFNEKLERPGFLLRLAGFHGPMWRSQKCHKKDEDMPAAARASASPPAKP